MFKKLSWRLLGVVVICSMVLGGVGIALADTGAPPQPQAQAGVRRGRGEVVAISADNFTVRGPLEREHTVYVDASTTFKDKAGNALSFSDLKVGDRVVGSVTRHADGKVYALEVRVLPPPTHYQGVGVVSVVEADEFTFTSRRGKVWEFYMDANTNFTDRAGNAHTYGDVQVGSRLFVQAELRADGKWWATRVGFPRPRPANAPSGPGGPGPHGPPQPPPQGSNTL